LAALPALTSLALCDSTNDMSKSASTLQLSGLSALTGLQQLTLHFYEDHGPILEAALLSTLTALTSLQARCTITAGSDLVALTALTRLKRLEIAR
jgi:hypothetical protein